MRIEGCRKCFEVGSKDYEGSLGNGYRHIAVGSRGKSPVRGMGDFVPPEAVGFCLNIHNILTSHDTSNSDV